MTRHLSSEIPAPPYDNLISALLPAQIINSGKIAGDSTETFYKKGTIFSKSADDNMLYILGTTPASGDVLTPYCILRDDYLVGSDDAIVEVWTAGCFNPQMVIVADGYDITEADRDVLRMNNIYFREMVG